MPRLERIKVNCQWLTYMWVGDVVAWIKNIPFEEWPQQHKVDSQLRPAMVTDGAWHNFHKETDRIVNDLYSQFAFPHVYNRMLSVVMPGHRIPPHTDGQRPEWLYRVHIPLTTNEKSEFVVGGLRFEMEVGGVYLVNTEAVHSVTNLGETPRIHFMFDVSKKIS